MKTVSTKLDKRNHDRLVDLCNEEGCTVSEALRDMVEQWCNTNEDDTEDNKEPEIKEQPVLIQELRNVKIVKSSEDAIDESKSHYDKFGNYWTFGKNTNKWTCHVDPKNTHIKQ